MPPSSPATSMETEVEGQNLGAAAEEWVMKNVGALPPRYEWNWVPIIAALMESCGIQGINMLVSQRDWDQDERTGPIRQDDRGKPIIRRVPHGGGSWNYVWYVPEWTHPDFKQDVTMSMINSWKSLAKSDAITKIYPALRPEDAHRMPTPWAKRFGIYPYETGGRSRLSPTTSDTRNPFDGYADLLNLLNDDSKRKVIEATRQSMQAGHIPTNPDPNYMDRTVLDNVLNFKGAWSGDQLKQNLAEALNNDDHSKNLDTLVDMLGRDSPQVLQAHATFFRNAQQDQDWQRTLFSGITSDELVTNNFFTMSNNYSCDLTGDIHPLFQRQRWDDSTSKGTDRWNPRFMYNLGGVRGEWDVRGNDVLWAVLQPALQLVTRILDRSPPQLEAITDMKTRSAIDPAYDQRTDPQSAYIYKYSLVGPDNLQNTSRDIRQLDHWGYDWTDAVGRVLDQTLVLDIFSGKMEPIPSDDKKAVDEAHEPDSPSYGYTRVETTPGNFFIYMYIDADLIWPLLVPEISLSEKLVASFGIASTLLHEFAHAIGYALNIVTEHAEWFETDPQVINTLHRVGDEVFDRSNDDTFEHFFENRGQAELGFDFEQSLWGGLAFNLLTHTLTNGLRRIEAVPVILRLSHWPQERVPIRKGYVSGGVVTYDPAPVNDYRIPLDIDYMAKFFTQKFWDDDFIKWGWEALKWSPETRLLKNTMSQVWLNHALAKEVYGEAEWEFIKFVEFILARNGLVILAEYLKTMYWEVLMPRAFSDIWLAEIHSWKSPEAFPLMGSYHAFSRVIASAQNIHGVYRQNRNGQVQEFQNYMSSFHPTYPGERPQDFETWKHTVTILWTEHFRDGGRLMSQARATFRHMMKDISIMQRMVFDYLNMRPEARASVYSGYREQDSGPIGSAYRRLKFFQEVAGATADLFNNLCTLDIFQPTWVQWREWESRYTSCRVMYDELLGMLAQKATVDRTDVKWKTRFGTVPSSEWRSGYERLRVLAHREYIRVDPRIREVIDEFVRVVSRAKEAANLKPAFDAHTVNEAGLADELDKARINLGQPLSSVEPDNFFNWKAPDGNNITYDNTWQNSSAAFNPQQFPGQQGPPDGMKSPIYPANMLGAKPPIRSDQPGPSFSPYHDVGGSFANAAPSPNPQLVAGVFGPGGPLDPGSPSSSQFIPTPGAPPSSLMFPNPYSTIINTTSDIQNLVGSPDYNPPNLGPYQTSESYREPEVPESPPFVPGSPGNIWDRKFGDKDAENIDPDLDNIT
ncbi:hypothetical protein M426DRAFT_12121 [Hypoxylon sp. CI-4A]|nr:hypothetical protein M426DRAFT_12121 [Hypoxylon sp. CI-4A]